MLLPFLPGEITAYHVAAIAALGQKNLLNRRQAHRFKIIPDFWWNWKSNKTFRMNAFGNNFRVAVFGESHGPVGVLIDGVPPGIL